MDWGTYFDMRVFIHSIKQAWALLLDDLNDPKGLQWFSPQAAAFLFRTIPPALEALFGASNGLRADLTKDLEEEELSRSLLADYCLGPRANTNTSGGTIKMEPVSIKMEPV